MAVDWSTCQCYRAGMATTRQLAAFRENIPELALGHTFNLTLAAGTGYVGYDSTVNPEVGSVRDNTGAFTRNGQTYTITELKQYGADNRVTFALSPASAITAMQFDNEQIVISGYPLTLKDTQYASGMWPWTDQPVNLLPVGNVDVVITDSRWLNLASQMHNISNTATAFLAAHLQTLDTGATAASSTTATGPDGGDRIIVSERMGEQQVTYARPSSAGTADRTTTNEAFFQSTRYGRIYLQLARRANIGVRVVPAVRR